MPTLSAALLSAHDCTPLRNVDFSQCAPMRDLFSNTMNMGMRTIIATFQLFNKVESLQEELKKTEEAL